MCTMTPVRVMKSKMPTVRIIAAPFRVLSRKNVTEYLTCCLKLVPLRGKNIFEPRLSNEYVVSFKASHSVGLRHTNCPST